MDFSQDDIDSLLAGGDAAVAEAEVEKPVPKQTESPPNAPPSGSHAAKFSVARLLSMEVPVIVKLASRSLTVQEVTQLKLGSILEFDLPADSELDLLINNKCIGHGTAVKVGENFGLRVSRIKTPRQVIKALG